MSHAPTIFISSPPETNIAVSFPPSNTFPTFGPKHRKVNAMPATPPPTPGPTTHPDDIYWERSTQDRTNTARPNDPIQPLSISSLPTTLGKTTIPTDELRPLVHSPPSSPLFNAGLRAGAAQRERTRGWAWPVFVKWRRGNAFWDEVVWGRCTTPNGRHQNVIVDRGEEAVCATPSRKPLSRKGGKSGGYAEEDVVLEGAKAKR